MKQIIEYADFICDKCRYGERGHWMGNDIVYCNKTGNSWDLTVSGPPKKCENFEKPPIIEKTITWDGLTPTIHVKEIKQ